MDIDRNANSAHRFHELSDETQEFLSQLREDDIETLKDGLRLVIAMRTVGTFMKWLIVGMLGLVVGVVMFGEAVIKIINWIKP